MYRRRIRAFIAAVCMMLMLPVLALPALAETSGKELGVFALTVPGEEGAVTAFLASDGKGRVCLVTDKTQAERLEGEDIALEAPGYRGTARLLGQDERFAYLEAEALTQFIPLGAADRFSADVTVIYVEARSLASSHLDLSGIRARGKQYNLERELPGMLLGAPVLDTQSYALVGTMVSGEDAMAAVRGCHNLRLPEEYTLFTVEVAPKKQNLMPFVAAAAAVLAAGGAVLILRRKKEKAEKEAQEQQAEAAQSVPRKQLQLRCLNGEFSGRTFPLSGRMQIGRAVDCAIRFPEGTPGVSSHHCVLFVNLEAQNAIVKDLGSTYGTYLRGEQLSPQASYAMQPGDELSLAWDGQRFRLEWSE